MAIERGQAPWARGVPLLGPLAMRRDPTRFLVRTAAQLGPIFRVRLLGRTWTILAGPEASELFARSDPAIWGRREMFRPVTDDLGTEALIPATEGERHGDLRRLLQLGFSRQLVGPHLPRLAAIVRDEASRWGDGHPIACGRAMTRIAAEQLGVVTANGSLAGIEPSIATYANAVLKIPLELWPGWVIRLLPFRRAKRRLIARFATILAEHRGHPPGPDRHADLFDAVLAAENSGGPALSDEDVFACVYFGWASGQLYMGRLYSFMWYLLLKHPDLAARVQNEVDAAAGNAPPTPESLKSLPLLRGVYLEALRLYPIQAVLPFRLKRPCSFRGFALPAGTRVGLFPYASHFMDGIFTNPLDVDPDRYRPPRSEHRLPHAFVSFGVWPRNCAATGLVEMLALTTISTLIHGWQCRLHPPDATLRIVSNPVPGPNRRLSFVAKRRVVGLVRRPPDAGDLLDDIAERLPPDLLHRLVAASHIRTCSDGETIVREGDEATEFFVIMSGSVEVLGATPTDEPGSKTLGRGEFFGEIGLIESRPRTATVRVPAGGSTRLLVLDRETFLRAVAECDLVGTEIAAIVRHRRLADQFREALPDLSGRDLAEVLGGHERVSLVPGEILFREGEPADRFYIIRSGQVDVLNHHPRGGEILLRQLTAGEFFGEIGLLEERPRTATVRAGEGDVTELVALERDAFLKLYEGSTITRDKITDALESRLLGRR